MSDPDHNADPMNTHYAVIAFSGDPASEHPDLELCGASPHLEVIACGPEDFCWVAVYNWTARHPLRMWESAEVLTRTVVLHDPARSGSERHKP